MIRLSAKQFGEMLYTHGLRGWDIQVTESWYSIVSDNLSMGELVDFVDKLPLKIAYPIKSGRVHDGRASISFCEAIE